jgi:hypothetical protein
VSWSWENPDDRIVSYLINEPLTEMADVNHKPFLLGVLADPQVADTDPLTIGGPELKNNLAWTTSPGGGFELSMTSESTIRVRNYRWSLEVCKAAQHALVAVDVKLGIILGDLVDKAAYLNAGAAGSLHAFESLDRALGSSASPIVWHSVFGNNDAANSVTRDGLAGTRDLGEDARELWASRIVPAAYRAAVTPARLYYSIRIPGTPAHPPLRLILLDAYDVSVKAASSPAAALQAADCIDFMNPGGGIDLDLVGPPDRLRFVSWNGGIGVEQLLWLRRELDEARGASERVFVFAHLACLPCVVRPDACLFNADAVLTELHRAGPGVVQAYFAGHDHDGGYAVDSQGIHHVVPCAPLECAVGEVSYGHMAIAADGWALHWTGKTPGPPQCHGPWPANGDVAAFR